MNRKEAFAALAKLIPGIWNRPGTIREMDELMAAAGVKPDAPSEPERNITPGRIGPDGLALIKAFEGCHRKRADGLIEAYPDPGSGHLPITIGWGSTRIDGKPFPLGTTITQAEADALLEADLVRYAGDVAKALGNALRVTSQKQFDALVSFHYNTGAIGRATLTRKHIAGDYRGAADEFLRWNRAGGRVLAGLTRRRKAERALYLEGSL